MLEFFGISQGWRLTGAIKTAERKWADGAPRHSGQRLMSWAVANARVKPKGNAIIIAKQASGSAKIDPLMGQRSFHCANGHKPLVVAAKRKVDLVRVWKNRTAG